QHWLPVETCGEQNGVAYCPFRVLAVGLRRGGLPAHLSQNASGVPQPADNVVTGDCMERAEHEPCLLCFFHDVNSRLISRCRSSSPTKRTVCSFANDRAIWYASLISFAISSSAICRSIPRQIQEPMRLEAYKHPLPICKITIPSS